MDASLRMDLQARLAADRDRGAEDPFTNPYLRFALSFSRRLESGDIPMEAVEAVVSELTLAAFADRAERLREYFGPADPEATLADLSAMFERLAGCGDFEAFAEVVAGAPFGIVLTAHPTFGLRLDLSRILVELATGFDRAGEALDDAARAERLTRASHIPHESPAELTLDVEHAWSVEALGAAQAAMETIYRVVLRVARGRWPERWTALTPRLVTLATWVGFDQDGRTDVTWQVSIAKRLDLKRIVLERRLRSIEPLLATTDGERRRALAALASVLADAAETVERQARLLGAAVADPVRTAEFARTLVEERERALVDCTPLLARVETALALAADDQEREALLVLRAGLAAEGLSLARVHVRLNAGQLHNAIRRQVNLETSPTDPANRRTYFAAIEQLIAEARPVQINFGDLMGEPASARRLMMTLAQMKKFIDASTPVRFLIAETEAGFTLLAALYLARLFDVEDGIEISPLFETAEAFERGEKVVEEALRSRYFRDHLKRHGRLTIEFGFSDSGRFIGQMAATFRIERLRLRLGEMLEAQGLAELEVVFFNTHGESIGRGGHPASLADRFRYAAPPWSRAELSRRGLRLKEEDAFQGGEGYLPLLSRTAALVTLKTALQTVLEPDPEAERDPIYDDPDFSAEFFATIEQQFTSLVADADYAALLGLFGTALLPKSGSRPVRRQTGDSGRPRTMRSVSELRAIPNNAVLQQLGYMANTLYGVGTAAAKHPDIFAAMRRDSPRFRRATDMVAAARGASDIAATSAYAATLDPELWLDRASKDDEPACDLAVRSLAERAGLGDDLARVLRRLQAEDIALEKALGPVASARRDRLMLLHGLRIGLVQRLCRLAVKIPEFTPRPEFTRAALQEQLLRLDAPGALGELTTIFPLRDQSSPKADFGEASAYTSEVPHAYHEEHETVFQPIARLYALILRISTAISHEIGASG